MTSLPPYRPHSRPYESYRHIKPAINWTIITLITLSVACLLRFSYATGLYVGSSRVRTEAIEAGAGYYDFSGPILRPAKWVWRVPCDHLTPKAK